MAIYRAISRRYRPQCFADVLGQDSVVTTLRNAIRQGRVGHAYLFCGPRGTGKTTLARIVAKALNCPNVQDGEPCNNCSSCKEIGSGHNLDVLEIDGASNRGIEEIRKVRDTVGFSSASGANRIFIIDEVHMLTNEAFNALLKTLEEPPEGVIFLFATTEPHKVLPTIHSRCQRFDLQRIASETIVQKLSGILEQIDREVNPEALLLVAQRADGGMRDAESLLDQILAFHSGPVTEAIAADILGVLPRSAYFELDTAGKAGELRTVFDISERIYSQGKDITHFVTGLTEHYRHLLLVKLANSAEALPTMSQEHRTRYAEIATGYTQEHLLSGLELLTEGLQTIRQHPSPRLALEALLLQLMRLHQRVPITFLTRRLVELEQSINAGGIEAAPQSPQTPSPPQQLTPPPPAAQAPTPPEPKPQPPAPAAQPPQEKGQVAEDPTPQPSDIPPPRQSRPAPPKAPPAAPPAPKPKRTPSSALQQMSKEERIKMQSRQDTLMQFAAVELQGTLQRK